MATRKILFCTDFSENSESARKQAVAYANAFGAELLILHIVSLPGLSNPIWTAGLPLDLSTLEREIREACHEEVERVADRCREEVADVKAYSQPGAPTGTEIARFAATHGIDLIVMGTHGWTGFKHLLMGSTAENVVRTAPCPVLTVRSSSE